MEEKALFEKVKQVLAQQLKIKDTDKITMESNIVADFNADSIDIIEMLMELEDTYNISVPSEKALEMKTVKDVVEFLQSAIK
ncbi:MAG TPA: acyl carrier protein [Clostridiales bacterium]|jgi:acyl carrier protein|nr:acyl carrier protein [Clostridiales bacterium]